MPASRRVISGQSLTEFALILPLLTMLMLGTIDLARVFYTKITIANASRVAAEYAANYNLKVTAGNNPATATSDVKQVAVREAQPFVTLSTSNVAFSTDWQPGTVYTVTITTNWSAVTPMINQLWGGGAITLTHSTQLRHSCKASAPCSSYP
jgi:Flp pilus assembly protein TadG